MIFRKGSLSRRHLLRGVGVALSLPMLDNTVVVFGSGMNSGEGGDHSPKNLPLIVAGGSKLGLRHGQHLAFDQNNHPPLNNVLLTVAQKSGLEVEKFNDSTGTVTGLVQ
jgi:hypothetical protein